MLLQGCQKLYGLGYATPGKAPPQALMAALENGRLLRAAEKVETGKDLTSSSQYPTV